MEKLDIYNIDGIKTGKIINRGENPLEGEYIKLAIVYLKSGDKYLVQKCSQQKGGDYAITGGHVTSGNTVKEQCVIEVKEELGLDIIKNNLLYLGTIVKGKGLFDCYLYEDINLQNKKMTFQVEEVETAYWLTKAQIDKLIEQNLFRKSSCEHYQKFIK